MTWTTEALLNAIGKAALDECVNLARLIEISGQTKLQLENTTLKLIKREWLTKNDKGCYKLTEAGREAFKAGQKVRSGPQGKWTGPRVNKNSLRINMWRAIRLRKKFTIPDLEMLVATGTEKDITSNIRKYVTALENAGILVRLDTREAGTSINSNGFVRYWLQDGKDPGPLAPVRRKSGKELYDPNTERLIPVRRESEHVA